MISGYLSKQALDAKLVCGSFCLGIFYCLLIFNTLHCIYSTISVMTSLVALSFYGASQLKFHWVERYDKLLVGSVLCLVGVLTLMFHDHDHNHGEVASVGEHLHWKIMSLWEYIISCNLTLLRIVTVLFLFYMKQDVIYRNDHLGVVKVGVIVYHVKIMMLFIFFSLCFISEKWYLNNNFTTAFSHVVFLHSLSYALVFVSSIPIFICILW